jgi:peptidoglycan/xylan/chitin deacetylase (PgdA/CDA1 family)
MDQYITIVMYHYVRDLKHSQYPRIKGLDIDQFEEQIAYIKKYYNPISAYDLMDAVTSGAELPPRSLLLSFDDAYIDHFTEVFPILVKENLSGCFFPPAKCILENKVLDVNKIHFILASVPDNNILINYIFTSLDQYRSSFNLESNEFYWQKCGISGRYDPVEVMFVKNMLQRDLPEALRAVITDQLFKKFVSDDEQTFSKELYMSIDQVSRLQENNMYVGSHGFDHYWLDSIPADTQRKEINLSLKFLREVGSDTKHWIMCYPYGAYNESLLSILKKRNCSLGFTTKVDLVDLKKDNPLTLSRLDANDLPKDSNSLPNEWTKKAIIG